MSKFNLLSIKNSRIGLLGGSFNPPHIGHINITLQAMRKFALCKVIWLVTPCNPLKNSNLYESLQTRVQRCIEITKPYSNKIVISDIEKSFRTFYSSNTIKEIHNTHSLAEIYWIIGCDNLLQMHKWYKWQKIFDMAKVIVCERTHLALKSHNMKVTHNIEQQHLFHFSGLANSHKRLYILHCKRINISSTKLRSML